MRLTQFAPQARAQRVQPQPGSQSIHFQRRQRISEIVLFIALSFGGMGWIPLGYGIEVNNLAAIAVIALAPLAWHPKPRVAPVLLLFMAAVLYIVAALTLRGDTDSLRFLLRPVIYLTAAISMSLMVPPRRPDRIAFFALLVLGLSFIASAYYAGVDFFGYAIKSVVNLDRRGFVFHAVRGTFNAFLEGDETIATTQLNEVSAFFAVGLAIFLAHRRLILAAATMIVILIFFSSSAVITAVIIIFIAALESAKTARSLLIFLVLCLLLGGLVAIYFEAIDNYIAVNVDADSLSRASRITQYQIAVQIAQENPIFGSGVTQSEVGYIHNVLLFAFSTSGVIPLAILLVSFAALFAILMRATWEFFRHDRHWLVVIGLGGIFAVRTLVGGGGGLPDPVASFALGYALLERSRLQSLGMGLSARAARRAAVQLTRRPAL